MTQLSPNQQKHWNQSRQGLIIGLFTFLLVVANGTTLLRIIASKRRKSRLVAQDYCMVAACLLTDTVAGELLYATSLGFGLHEYRLLDTAVDPVATLQRIFAIIWSNSVLNGVNFLTIKLSILLLYKDLFWSSRNFRIAWWINLGYAILWTIGSTLFYILQCTPVSYYWTRVSAALGVADAPTGTCVSSLSILGLPILLNIASDVCVLILPLPILWKLHTTTKKRIRLVALFTVGLIAVIFGLVRYILAFTTVDTSDFSCKFMPNPPLCISGYLYCFSGSCW